MQEFSLVYTGPNEYVLMETDNRKKIIFSKENNYTHTPNTYDEIYQIIKVLDGLVRFSLDPLSSQNLRRQSANIADAIVIDEDKVLREQWTELSKRKRELLVYFENQYSNQISWGFAKGNLNEMPQDFEELKAKYGLENTIKELGDQTLYLDTFEEFKKYKSSEQSTESFTAETQEAPVVEEIIHEEFEPKHIVVDIESQIGVKDSI
jgi:hypothetical protein